MLLAQERRAERRIPFKHVIRYSYPALNSGGHERVYGLVKKVCNLAPCCDALVNKFISTSIVAPFIFPKKTWASTEDLSNCGLSLVVSRRFDIGQDLLLFDERLSHRPVPARVMWCGGHGEMFKAGLRYTNVNFFASFAQERALARQDPVLSGKSAISRVRSGMSG